MQATIAKIAAGCAGLCKWQNGTTMSPEYCLKNCYCWTCSAAIPCCQIAFDLGICGRKPFWQSLRSLKTFPLTSKSKIQTNHPEMTPEGPTSAPLPLSSDLCQCEPIFRGLSSRPARAPCVLCGWRKARCDARDNHQCSNCTFENVQCVLTSKQSRK